MALLGKAAVAMWWDMAPEHRDEFQNWHSHEHFPERMSVPGFLRGARWAAADGGEGFFIMYELADYETLSSPGYLARLNSPSAYEKSVHRKRHAQQHERQQAVARVNQAIDVGVAANRREVLQDRLARRRHRGLRLATL